MQLAPSRIRKAIQRSRAPRTRRTGSQGWGTAGWLARAQDEGVRKAVNAGWECARPAGAGSLVCRTGLGCQHWGLAIASRLCVATAHRPRPPTSRQELQEAAVPGCQRTAVIISSIRSSSPARAPVDGSAVPHVLRCEVSGPGEQVQMGADALDGSTDLRLAVTSSRVSARRYVREQEALAFAQRHGASALVVDGVPTSFASRPACEAVPIYVKGPQQCES